MRGLGYHRSRNHSKFGVTHGKQLKTTLGRRMPLWAGARPDKRSSNHDGNLPLYRLPTNELERVFFDRDDPEHRI